MAPLTRPDFGNVSGRGNFKKLRGPQSFLLHPSLIILPSLNCCNVDVLCHFSSFSCGNLAVEAKTILG